MHPIPLLRRVSAVALALACSIAATPASANIGVSPLRVTIAPGERSAAFTITNVQATDLTVQAEVVRWERVNGEDKQTKSNDWILNPPVMTSPALGSRVIRMALKNPAPSPEEVAYRLIITEVRAPGSERGLSVVVRMHVSLPVFIAAVNGSRAKPEWTARRDGAKRISIRVRNAGASHIHVTRFMFKDESGKPLQDVVQTYVFGGETRTWIVDLPPDAAATHLALQAETDNGVQTIPIEGQ